MITNQQMIFRPRLVYEPEENRPQILALMTDIAFHITDITENSLRAGARHIQIALVLTGSRFRFSITDDGCGMEEATLRRVTDPFYTTRTTRRAGLGLPFLFQNAEQCGGVASIRSEPGRGTVVEAQFPLDAIDCPPAGDLAQALGQLLSATRGVEIRIEAQCGDAQFEITSAEVREALGDIPAGHPQAAALIVEILRENLRELFGNALF